MSNEKRPFDPVKFRDANSGYLRQFSRYHKGPRLEFNQRCAIYACVYDKAIPQAVVCRVFNISRSTVSYIAGCRDDTREKVRVEFDDGKAIHAEDIGVDGYLTKHRDSERKPRYQDVVDEFERLGADEFIRTYLTKDIAKRIMEVRQQVTGKLYLGG